MAEKCLHEMRSGAVQSTYVLFVELGIQLTMQDGVCPHELVLALKAAVHDGEAALKDEPLLSWNDLMAKLAPEMKLDDHPENQVLPSKPTAPTIVAKLSGLVH